ncbi:MAG: hypothetical protein AB7S83_00690 [Candidatus Methanomethylophilaceae archaeon]
MNKQTRFRTSEIRRSDSISVPVGNPLWTEGFFEHFHIDDVLSGLKTRGTDPTKFAELTVAYKAGGNFSILKCHDFVMPPPIREHMGIPEFDVRGLYRAVEISGENRESAITHFRQVFLKMYGPEVTDTVSDRTSPVISASNRTSR